MIFANESTQGWPDPSRTVDAEAPQADGPETGDPASTALTDEAIPLRVMDGCCAPATKLRWSAEEAGRLATLLKAVAHPVRLQIVELLGRMGGQVCVCDIELHFQLSQSTISHHLKVLRQAGILGAEQRGVWIYYHTRPEAIAQLRGLVANLAGSE